MASFLTRSLIALLVVFLIDLYVFQAVRTVSQHLGPALRKTIFLGYWSLTVLTLGTFILAALTRGTPPNAFKTYFAAALLILFLSKIFVVVFLLLDDAWRLMKYISHQLFQGPEHKAVGVTISRSEFLNRLALVAGALPFATFIYGMVAGAYNYKVRKVKLRYPNLPAAFEGYRLLQISDLHVGSFRSPEPLQRAVALINRQQADVIVFTGDLVNNVATEVLPHLPALSQLRAPDGVFSVLGNHDYGDYVAWESKDAKLANLRQLHAHQRKMGWQLLLNEHRLIQRGGAAIALLGVENWSAKMHFPRYGDLSRAHHGTEQIPFKVLLSHDPSHWRAQVLPDFPDIDLTLSGHTHGMQFGLRLPGLQWSPVQYVYEQWAGLYEQLQQRLYVNVGLGFLGYPGRVGISPEITVFEFSRA